MARANSSPTLKAGELFACVKMKKITQKVLSVILMGNMISLMPNFASAENPMNNGVDPVSQSEQLMMQRAVSESLGVEMQDTVEEVMSAEEQEAILESIKSEQKRSDKENLKKEKQELLERLAEIKANLQKCYEEKKENPEKNDSQQDISAMDDDSEFQFDDEDEFIDIDEVLNDIRNLMMCLDRWEEFLKTEKITPPSYCGFSDNCPRDTWMLMTKAEILIKNMETYYKKWFSLL